MSQAAFTCITCHVVFTNADIQRLHYKSDWHRYNLKRKVVGLPPVSVQSFQEKVAAQQALVASNQSHENVVGVSCKLCQRKFSTFNAHKNHLQSKKHREAEAKELKNMKKTLQEQSPAHIEKSLSDEMDESIERHAINKALSDAQSGMKQPTVLRSSDETAKDKDDNPRLRWYQKQVKEIKKREMEEEKEESEEEWEDMSDDEGTIGDESESDDVSQTGSTCTDNSSLSGIMAKVKLDSDADVESLLSESLPNQYLLGPKDCLFCSKRSSNMENSVSHMSKRHGFFIPELDYLIDLKGLLSYLGEKVGMGNVCLWCNEKGHPFYSLRAVRHHMKDKGHCKMLTDGDAAMEYADFYDFSSSYPDSDSEDDFDDDMSVAIPDVVHHGDDEEETELVLPSGTKIGHRSLMRYYKQNFPPIQRFHHRTKRPLIERLMAQYRAIGWHGYSGTAVMKKHQRDIRYVQNMKSKYLQQLGVKNNKTALGRLRPQVIF